MTYQTVVNSPVIREGKLLPLISSGYVVEEWDADLTGDEVGSRVVITETWNGQSLSEPHAAKVWEDDPYTAHGIYSIYSAFIEAFGELPEIMREI